MNKLIMFLMFLLAFSSFTYAEEQSLPTIKAGNCIALLQNCANCTSVNFTGVYLNGNKLLENAEANKNGSLFNYTFCNTYNSGLYIVNGIGDIDGVLTVFAYSFEVNKEGVDTSVYGQTEIGVVITISLLLIGIILLFGYLGYIFYNAQDMSFFFCFLFWYIAMLIPLFLIRMVSSMSILNDSLKDLLSTLYVVYMWFYFFMIFMLVVYFMALVMGYLDWKKKPGWMKKQPV